LNALGHAHGPQSHGVVRRRDGSLAISEVGAPAAGAQFTTLMSYANDFDLYRAWARLMVFEQFDPPKRAFRGRRGFPARTGQRPGGGHPRVGASATRVAGLVMGGQTAPAGAVALAHVRRRRLRDRAPPQTAVVEAALERLVSKIRVELA